MAIKERIEKQFFVALGNGQAGKAIYVDQGGDTNILKTREEIKKHTTRKRRL